MKPVQVRRAMATASLLTTTLVTAGAAGVLPAPGNQAVAAPDDQAVAAPDDQAVAAPDTPDLVAAGPVLADQVVAGQMLAVQLATSRLGARVDGGGVSADRAGSATAPSTRTQRDRSGRPAQGAGNSSRHDRDTRLGAGAAADRVQPSAHSEPPRESGQGRRVVFDEEAQHVWLMSGSGRVRDDYPVSGSRFENLEPGHYEVYSRSRHATSFDLSSTMEYMVRFTQGEQAAIGFHAIPVDDEGERVQRFSQLGTPLSHGCIRQRHSDARTMWHFAGVGTLVVVV